MSKLLPTEKQVEDFIRWAECQLFNDIQNTTFTHQRRESKRLLRILRKIVRYARLPREKNKMAANDIAKKVHEDEQDYLRAKVEMLEKELETKCSDCNVKDFLEVEQGETDKLQARNTRLEELLFAYQSVRAPVNPLLAENDKLRATLCPYCALGDKPIGGRHRVRRSASVIDWIVCPVKVAIND